MLYKKDEEKRIIIGIYEDTDEMAAFAYQILGETLVLKKNNGMYYAMTKPPFEYYYYTEKKQFVFNEEKCILLPVQKREKLDYVEDAFLDEENLLIPTVDNAGKRYFDHYRIKNQGLELINHIENKNGSFVDKESCFDEGYILINKNRVYDFKSGQFHEEVFDHIYTRDTGWDLKINELVGDTLYDFVMRNDIALGVLSVKASKTMPKKRKKEERMAFVKLDRKGEPNSNLFYIEDYDIKQISLKEHSFDEAIHLLQIHLDSLALSAEYKKENLPKKINKAIKKSFNK